MVTRAVFILCLILLGACKEVQKNSDVFTQPTPRELYARNFLEGDTSYLQWKTSFESALRDTLQIDLPFHEVGHFDTVDFQAYSFNTQLRQGEKLIVSCLSNNDSTSIFIDLFQYEKSDSVRLEAIVSEKRHGRLPVELPIKKSGIYKILLQPELFKKSNFQIEIYTGPTLPFPVVEVSDNAIQSFWGATRSGGKRTHEGVDIFAPRLTPVIAVADGRIGYSGERGLGGKQVWLREGVFKNSFYYAHLDSIKVATSQKVFKGDTLGYVGNTGNAITTAPHLHFGVYKKGGPIDPLPFINRNEHHKKRFYYPQEKD